MKDLFSMISALRRPRLLISAARHGVADYERTRHLKRVLGGFNPPTPGAAVMRLLEIERGLNAARNDGDATYDVAKHVDILIAIMGEARLLRRQETS
ncbi:DUF6477 family protein [Shimia ponticola]|uniref:DUF6477 family protein n=1 Tax=Shimia ponticola TaxID=2582893 RepID=UPI0011BEDD6C|nr:DUF6477 family protein [Shimia ponticola]